MAIDAPFTQSLSPFLVSMLQILLLTYICTYIYIFEITITEHMATAWNHLRSFIDDIIDIEDRVESNKNEGFLLEQTVEFKLPKTGVIFWLCT
jgi:hypothetical protein